MKCVLAGQLAGLPVVHHEVEPAQNGDGGHAVLGSSTVQVDYLVLVHHQTLHH